MYTKDIMQEEILAFEKLHGKDMKYIIDGVRYYK